MCLPPMEMKWSWKYCTLLNEIRGTRSLEKEEALLGMKNKQTPLNTFKVLSYNVCFRDLELHERMEAIGDLIQLHSHDVLCLQEVTREMYQIFQQSTWWWKAYRFEQINSKKSYSCKPFSNSKMGRELCLTEIEVGGEGSKQLVIATSHLESPCPTPPTWTQMYSKERLAQAKEAILILKGWPNVIFLSNQMISGNWPLRKQLDQFVCKFQDFKICGIEMIGMESIPGLSYRKEKKVRGQLQELMLPVLPSDHYGLLLTISNK
ncbi:hypothetical protein MKX01_040269 [Papaver californicum]|nr:hypothetical protein MKX01_040269 [Papaver californicum]